MRAWLVAIVCLGLSGCAATLPRPQSLRDADTTREAPAVTAARARAPQAHAHAENLRQAAERALQDGDSARAQILGERALAAYEHAVVLARLADSEARRAKAAEALDHAQKRLDALDQQQRRALAEADALELRARVLRDTMPLPENAPSTPERERARLEAARTLSLEARLLCAAARLLKAEQPSLAARFQGLDQLDARLSEGALPAPIDTATELRSRCLSDLTLARRPRTEKAPESGATDRLLEELSRASLDPVRDDRGVVVTLRGAFAATDDLATEASARLADLGRVAKQNPTFPLQVVLHTARGDGGPRQARRLERAASELKKAGAARVEPFLGGDRDPLVDPKRAGAALRNERLEVVFVSPTAS